MHARYFFFKQPSLSAYFHLLVVDGLLPLMEMHTQCVEYEQKHTFVYKQTVCLKILTCTNTESLSGPDIFYFRLGTQKERKGSISLFIQNSRRKIFQESKIAFDAIKNPIWHSLLLFILCLNMTLQTHLSIDLLIIVCDIYHKKCLIDDKKRLKIEGGVRF